MMGHRKDDKLYAKNYENLLSNLILETLILQILHGGWLNSTVPGRPPFCKID